MLAFVSLLAPFSTINVQQKPDVPLVAPPEPHPRMTGFEAQGEMFDFWCPKGKTTRVHLVHVGAQGVPFANAQSCGQWWQVWRRVLCPTALDDQEADQERRGRGHMAR